MGRGLILDGMVEQGSYGTDTPDFRVGLESRRETGPEPGL